jgi:hypothetical protein
VDRHYGGLELPPADQAAIAMFEILKDRFEKVGAHDLNKAAGASVATCQIPTVFTRAIAAVMKPSGCSVHGRIHTSPLAAESFAMVRLKPQAETQTGNMWNGERVAAHEEAGGDSLRGARLWRKRRFRPNCRRSSGRSWLR